MKFVLAIEKKNKTNIGSVKGHNVRGHPTKSQLPKEAWFTPEGHHQVIAFNDGLVEKAKSLAKRKDAVLAVEFVFSVGNQTEWREFPSKKHPAGEPKSDSAEKMKALVAGVKAAAIAEFGEERIISIDLHTDESTPHVHVVFTPIQEEKLQAKHWMNGPDSVALLRERLHANVRKHIECDYEKGAPGGKPHDPTKAAGGVNAPKPELGFIEKAADQLTKKSLIEKLRSTIEDLRQQVQTLFSKLKAAEKRAAAAESLQEKAIKSMHEAKEKAQKQQKEIEFLRQKVDDLSPKNEKKFDGIALENKFPSLISSLKTKDSDKKKV